MICDGCWHKNNCADYGEKLIHCEYFEPMTEQEYIQSCNAERLAEVFFDYRYVNATPRQQLWLSANEDFVKGGIMEWLKQPHQKE